MLKCRCCGHYFDEPYEYVETHGFTHGPYEHFEVCPNCFEGNYGDAQEVEDEEARALEEDD